MSEETISALWKKTHKHADQISDLNAQVKVHASLLDQYGQEFRQMNQEAASRDSELKTILDRQQRDLQGFTTAYHEQRGELLGAARVGKWGITTILAVAGVAITAYAVLG